MLKLRLCVWLYLSVWQSCSSDGQQSLWWRAGELQLVDLSLPHCVARARHSIVFGAPPPPCCGWFLWRRWGTRRHQSDGVISDRSVSTFQLQKLWWVVGRNLLMCTVPVCVWGGGMWLPLITLIISSNYLQTANEFLRNRIMLCVRSHHPLCSLTINLLINKYN